MERKNGKTIGSKFTIMFSKCPFGKNDFCQLILLFSLFLLLFIGFTILFDTIHRFHYTISIKFYIYLQYFQEKVFCFNKINAFQTDPKFLRKI